MLKLLYRYYSMARGLRFSRQLTVSSRLLFLPLSETCFSEAQGLLLSLL